MSHNSDSVSRVSSVLRGDHIAARGITFVSESVLRTWSGDRSTDTPVLALVASELDLDFAFVKADEPDAKLVAETLREGHLAPMWVVNGPFGMVAAERGWTTSLMDVVRARDDIGAALDAQVLEALGQVDQAALVGSSALVVAEDLSAASGFLMGPDDVLELIVPRLGRLAKEAELRGMSAALHSDGDIRTFLPALVEAGFSAVHIGGIGWKAFESQYEAARREGLAVIGGLEGAELHEGHDAAVAVGGKCAALASANGLLIADDGGMTTPEEVAAFTLAIKASSKVDSRREN